jgi:hypothetical protein
MPQAHTLYGSSQSLSFPNQRSSHSGERGLYVHLIEPLDGAQAVVGLVVRIEKGAKFAFADAANQRSAGVRIDERDLVLHDALPRSGKDAK